MKSSNSKLFWKEVSKINSKSSEGKPNDVIDGACGTGACENFRIKYKELYSKCTNENYDDLLLFCENEIENKCLCTDNEVGMHLHNITPLMVGMAVKKLKRGKTEELPILTTDNIIDGTNKLNIVLSLLFTFMIKHGFSSEIFNLIIISPILKDNRLKKMILTIIVL